ncbi:MAG TPA: tetratricopeptide repeat protein [Pirellulales bacterium]|nr:tetratricopeptide repeat protein [Pirellulales bacterium]
MRPPRFKRVRRLVPLALVTCVAAAAALGLALGNGARACYRRALLALDQGDLHQARLELLRLGAYSGYKPHASLITAELLLREQRPMEAIKELHIARDHPDTRVIAWTLIGRTMHQQHRFQPAERALKTALRFDPECVEAHRWLGNAYLEVGAVREGTLHLRKAAELAPWDPEPNRAIARVLRLSGHPNEAAVHYIEAIRRDENLPPTARASGRSKPDDRKRMLVELAQCQVSLQRHADALATLRDAPEIAETLALRAECFEAMGDVAEFQNCIEQALRLEPDHFPSLLGKARAALESNDPAAALRALHVAVEQHPHDQNVNYLLSQAYHRSGEDEAAKKCYDEFDRIRSLAQEYHELSRRTMREPRQPQLCYQLGLIAERLGWSEAAAAWYRATLQLDPRHEGAKGRFSHSWESRGPRP